MKEVIALYSSCQESGKSTIADLFVENGYTRLKFADVLKDMLRPLLWTVAPTTHPNWWLEGPGKNELVPILNVTARWLMQSLGTEWMRNSVSSSGWVDIMQKKIQETNGNIIIDDMRFPNEYNMLMSLPRERYNVVMVRLERPGYRVDTSHASEGSLDNFHFHWNIYNDGTVEDLLEEVKINLLTS